MPPLRPATSGTRPCGSGVSSGYDDPAITAAALIGLGEARYRLDDDDGALASWESAVKLGETPWTYLAWRNVAAARVRAGDLPGAIDAYRRGAATRASPRTERRSRRDSDG